MNPPERQIIILLQYTIICYVIGARRCDKVSTQINPQNNIIVCKGAPNPDVQSPDSGPSHQTRVPPTGPQFSLAREAATPVCRAHRILHRLNDTTKRNFISLAHDPTLRPPAQLDTPGKVRFLSSGVPICAQPSSAVLCCCASQSGGVARERVIMAGPKSKSPAAKGAGKGKKSASAGKKIDDEREETLQAVV